MVKEIMVDGRPVLVGVNETGLIWARYRDRDRAFLTIAQIMSLITGD